MDIIPKSIQLIAGRTGREYNQRKNRKGAFWEDRYHATAVKTGKHLIRCLAYIDLNMVRAGVVQHPGEWVYGGYQEIQNPRQRYTLINRQKLTALLGIKDNDQLPFGIGEVLGGFSIIMFWIQISAAKIILQNFPPSVFQFIQGSSGSGLLPGLIIGNFINIFLLIVFSFILSVIYSLAKVGDRRVSDKLGNS